MAKNKQNQIDNVADGNDSLTDEPVTYKKEFEQRVNELESIKEKVQFVCDSRDPGWVLEAVYNPAIDLKAENFESYIVWDALCQYEELSEKFMEVFKNQIDWQVVSRHQELSKFFIRKHKDRLDISYLKGIGKIGQADLIEFGSMFPKITKFDIMDI